MWGAWEIPVWILSLSGVIAAVGGIAAGRTLPPGPAWRPWVMAVSGVAGVFGAAWLFSLALRGAGLQIVPPFPTLPLYSLLRAVPGKLGGMVAAFTFPGLVALLP
jgi:hypothetical protein